MSAEQRASAILTGAGPTDTGYGPVDGEHEAAGPAVLGRGPDPVEDVAISLPEPDGPRSRPPHREQELRLEARLARRRFYSYCLTLTACVFALMTFMYGIQGEADSDGTFITLGLLFAATTAYLLWAAVRITRVNEPYAFD